MRSEAVWQFDGGRLSEALRVRDAAAQLVKEWYPEVPPDETWIVLTELITNVVRHAPGTAELRIEAANHRPRVHVLDRGPGTTRKAHLPINPYSEGGRGLFIVSQVAGGFELRNRPSGGTHAVAQL